MTTIVFYEKPGCVNNTRQKALLAAAGYEVIARNLLTEKWTAARLRQFFGDRPVAEWLNRSAPEIKSGEIVPEQLDSQTALQLMIDKPLLIRRPLMQVGERCEVGFEMDQIEAWLGFTLPSNQQDLQTCPQTLNPVSNQLVKR
jgi:nitrogenase-associated protein